MGGARSLLRCARQSPHGTNACDSGSLSRRCLTLLRLWTVERCWSSDQDTPHRRKHYHGLHPRNISYRYSRSGIRRPDCLDHRLSLHRLGRHLRDEAVGHRGRLRGVSTIRHGASRGRLPGTYSSRSDAPRRNRDRDQGQESGRRYRVVRRRRCHCSRSRHPRRNARRVDNPLTLDR